MNLQPYIDKVHKALAANKLAEKVYDQTMFNLTAEILAERFPTLKVRIENREDGQNIVWEANEEGAEEFTDFLYDFREQCFDTFKDPE